jgi:hypothetical protein
MRRRMLLRQIMRSLRTTLVVEKFDSRRVKRKLVSRPLENDGFDIGIIKTCSA